MTSREAGLSGSYNWSDASHPVPDPPSQQQQQQPLPQHPLQDPNSAGTMSATTVYHPSATYYPPPQFTHDPSNPQPSIYRRPSHPGVPIYSNQCTPVPSASSFGVSEQQQQGQDNVQRGNVPAPPLPPSSSVAQFNPALAQPAGLRTGTNTPISISQPHPRISSLSNPTTPIEPPLHLDIVNNPVGEIVTMLAAKLQNLITLNDRIKAASSRPNTPYTHTPSQGKSDPRLLSFHARNIPSITITAYLTRILKYCPTDPEVFISVLVYFDRIMRIANQHAQPLFGAYYSSYNVLPGPPLVHSPLPGPSHDDDSFAIDSFNVHRLVITTVAVATKFFSDQFYTNSRYARVRPPSLFVFRLSDWLMCCLGRGVTIGRTESSGDSVFDSAGFQFNDTSRGDSILRGQPPSLLDYGATTSSRQGLHWSRRITAPIAFRTIAHDGWLSLYPSNTFIDILCNCRLCPSILPRPSSLANGATIRFASHGRRIIHEYPISSRKSIKSPLNYILRTHRIP
jgi:PHO85 cyclin-6/7